MSLLLSHWTLTPKSGLGTLVVILTTPLLSLMRSDRLQNGGKTGISIKSIYQSLTCRPHIICDGRILASLWDISHVPGFPGRVGRPNEKLVEDYFVNLAIRGGGLFLGTDNGPEYVGGINNINDALGLARFYGWAYEPGVWLANVDLASPLVTYPKIATHHDVGAVSHLWADSSSSFSPSGLQPNGLIFYPVAWHNTSGSSRPSISSTIRGGHGLRISIKSPSCRNVVDSNTTISFQANHISGTAPSSWTWSSDLDGNFATTATASAKLSVGRHTVRVRAVNSLAEISEDIITVDVIEFSKKNTCFTLSIGSSTEVTEYFPIQRAPAAIGYYSYDTAKPTRSNTVDRLEDRVPRSANIFFYQDETGSVSFVTILSDASEESSLSLRIKVDSPTTPTVQLRDGPTDRSIRWDSTTKTADAHFNWKGTTKGVVLGPITTATSIERACVSFTITEYPVNVDYVVVHGHIRSSTSPSNPEALTLSKYDAKVNSTIKICRIRCSCETPEVLTDLKGEIRSFSTEFGTEYTFTSGSGIVDTKYSDKTRCTWLFSLPAAEGIGFKFLEWDVASGDAITLYRGDDVSSKLIDSYSSSANPGARLLNNNKGGVIFAPNNDGNSKAGWRLSWAVVPTVTSVYPSSGSPLITTRVLVEGTNFAPGTQVVKVGTIVINTVTWISTTQMTFELPPQPSSLIGQKFNISVSNDGLYFSANSLATFEFVDLSCNKITNCGACNSKPECDWCNNLDNPSLSYCFQSSVEWCSAGSSDTLVDPTCCTQCTGLNGCGRDKGNGYCQCNNTCTCNPPFYGPSCECKECPKDSLGKVCSGRGTCNCDGTCDCEFGFTGDQCECSTCEGEPLMCSGNGECSCSGECICDAGFTSSSETHGVCDCPETCPNDCSGKGVCECGICSCMPGYTVLPDCSCQESCEEECTGNKVCGCSGMCECAAGFFGDDCTETVDCSPFYACDTCVQNEACVWCLGAYRCENKHSLSYCDISDKANNPLSFVAVTRENCPSSDEENDLLTEGDTGLVIGGIVGGIIALAVSLLSGAVYLTNKPVSGPLVDGYE
eukprot:TRINITY_DN8397_c0_g1_i2.p1 TRINITY_DN8397_c0_g1~~TRINITY_DN8397_c0_g1_i2.p1  ORF type:complete len:1060 (-),score=141.63 TRINITY_DN8397_c0_g1_i2:17-3196(-)